MRRLLALLFACCFALPGRALVNAEIPGADEHRFDAVGAWGHTARLNPGRGHRAEHQWYGAAVLIAPDVVLTAKHLLPNGEDNLPRPGQMTVRFRRHADGSLGSRDGGAESYHQVTIERFVLCPRADLMLCILTEPVEHIEPVAVDLSGERFDEAAVALAGWGGTSNWKGRGGPRRELRVGGHTAGLRGGFVGLASYETEPREDPDGKPGQYITDENTVPNLYDSGGSIFTQAEDGGVQLVGIIATYTGGAWVGAFAEDEAFPLSAAVRGADALLDALGD